MLKQQKIFGRKEATNTGELVPVDENRQAARTAEDFGSSPGQGSGSEADLARPEPRVEEGSCRKKLGLLKSLDKLSRFLLWEQEGFLQRVCSCWVQPSPKSSTGMLPGCGQE